MQRRWRRRLLMGCCCSSGDLQDGAAAAACSCRPCACACVCAHVCANVRVRVKYASDEKPLIPGLHVAEFTCSCARSLQLSAHAAVRGPRRCTAPACPSQHLRLCPHCELTWRTCARGSTSLGAVPAHPPGRPPACGASARDLHPQFGMRQGPWGREESLRALAHSRWRPQGL